MAFYDDPQQMVDFAYSRIDNIVTSLGLLNSDDDLPMQLRIEAKAILVQVRKLRSDIPKFFNPQGG